MLDLKHVSSSNATTFRIPLDATLLDAYEAEAKRQNLSVEEVCQRRLSKCQGHAAERGIFFNDIQRNRLEKLLGSHVLKDADHALVRLEQAFQISVEGVSIQLDSSTVSRMKSRLRRDRPFQDQVATKIQYLIQAWLRGEV